MGLEGNFCGPVLVCQVRGFVAQELPLIQKEQLCPLSSAVWLSEQALHLGPLGWVKADIPECLALDIRGEVGILTPFS